MRYCPGMMRERLQAKGDRDLAERILADREVRQVIEEYRTEADKFSARRQLLATAVRLAPSMAPDLHATIERCRTTLEMETTPEIYVFPSPMFNAAAVRPERGRMFLIFSSELLESFDGEELSFVVGHELGHHLFDHHAIPVAALLEGGLPGTPGLALSMFAWQRYAEISCDRAGIVCAGGLAPAASALLKLASGLRGDRVKLEIDAFLAQVPDMRAEADRLATAEEPARADWFATHPFSPLRLAAARLFAASELMEPGGTPRDQLEHEVHDLMSVMEPSYLQERSEVAEAMRRLLFGGGIALAYTSGMPDTAELAELEKLLGPGALPGTINPKAIADDMPRRIEEVKRLVPPLRRAQVLRDLCVIARADGAVDARERDILHDIARSIDVDPEVVSCSLDVEIRMLGPTGDPPPAQ